MSVNVHLYVSGVTNTPFWFRDVDTWGEGTGTGVVVVVVVRDQREYARLYCEPTTALRTNICF